MANISKRTRAIREQVVPGKIYPVVEALDLLKKLPPTKFDQAIEVCVNLGIDTRKPEQASIRGAIVLPHGTGKKVRIAVFAQGAQADAAKAAGADQVGFEDLAEIMKSGDLNYDIVIATPDAMRVVGQLGQLLGPRGLMPNPKEGTVTADAAIAVKNARAGQVRYKADKTGTIHCAIGKMSFETEQLRQNLAALLSELKKAKPGLFKKMTVSSTMGPGLTVDQASLGS